MSLDGVRLVHAPWFFRLPGFRRYGGYALWRTILVRSWPPPEDLVTHELAHVWQAQHRRWHQLWTWLVTSYRENPYEREAREAVARTK